MGDVVNNFSKGRAVEFYNRIDLSDPTNSAFEVFLFLGAGTDATFIDLATIAAVEADAGFSEATFTNYASFVLTDAELDAFPAPDLVNDRYDIDLPDQTWSAAGNGANDTLTRLIVGYDSDSTGGTDANIIPVTAHDFAVTTDGSDLTAQFDPSGFFRAA